MKSKPITILEDTVAKEFLPFVRRPSRYIGGEINQIKKDLSAVEFTIALCFPDVYEVAASYAGLAVIYDILNQTPNIAAERLFLPWIDAEKILRQKQIPLFTIESKAAAKDFDCIGFSLTNELCYTNVLNTLDLAGLNVRTADRCDDDPLIIAGGLISNCCEPIADFIDLFIIGDGEEAAPKLANFLIGHKKAGSTKKQILIEAAKKFDWVYVPSLYRFEYNGDKIKSFQPAIPGLPTQFKSAVAEDFENAPVPLKPLVPFTQAVHERVSIEIMRGCPGRCRFCQVSFCRRPIRYRSVDKIFELAVKCYHATGFDTVSLLSLSTADYPKLEQLIPKLHEYFQDKHVGLSIPSLRVDQQLKILPELITSVRKAGLTIAVEAASEKVRKIINKPLKDTDLFTAVEAAYKAGWQKLKLYFMVGLPGESEDDIKKIVKLSYDLAKLRKKIDGRTGQINAAVSWFVPKPHTPFAWLPQKSKQYFENAKRLILDEKKKLNARFIRFKFHGIEQSILEAAISRGDRRLCNVIETAWQNGARFDLWSETFNYRIWLDAFKKFNLDPETLSQKQFDTSEILPWQHLAGPAKDYLLKHLEDAMETQNNKD